jgi:hypothetical protein
VRLSQRQIGLWLNSAGVAERIPEFAELQSEIFLDVLESDERGLWVKVKRADGANHLVLLRWEYVALIDITLGWVKTKGFGPVIKE